MPPTGRRIGPYEVVRELGRGGMGVVHEVRDPAGRRLALKLIINVSEPEALARFRREAELMARVSHPNVVRVHALDVAPDGPFIVTELVDGQALGAVTRKGPLAPARAARVARDLADAVEALHARGILHRDLKPQNVIVRPDDTPVLLDFGLARDLVSKERLTVTGTLVGTPVYMAPEQAEGASPSTLGPAVDVYALGALLVEALSGRPPFDSSGGHLSTLKHVMFDEPCWPSSVAPGTPHGLEAICRVAMSKSPAERYASAAALKDDLDRYLRGDAPLALARFPAPRSKGRGVIVVAALVLVAAIAALALLVTRDDARDDATPTVTTPTVTTPTDRRPAAPTGPRPLPELVAAAEPGRKFLTLSHGEGYARGLLVPGARALTYGADRAVVLWALEDPPRQLRRVELDDQPLTALLLDDDHVALRTWTGVVRLDLATLTEREACPIEPQEEGSYTFNRGLALSSEALVAPGKRIERLDPTTLARLTPLVPYEGEELLELNAAAAYGNLVVVGGGISAGGPVLIGRGQLLSWRKDESQPPPQNRPTSAVTSLAVLPGPRPIVACGMLTGFLVLDILDDSRALPLGEPDPRLFRVLAHSVDIQDLAFTPDGELLLSAALGAKPHVGTMIGEVRAWSVADGKRRWELADCGLVLSLDRATIGGRLVLCLGTLLGDVDLWVAPGGGP